MSMLPLGIKQWIIGVQRPRTKEEQICNKLRSRREVEKVYGGNHTTNVCS
jgi:hypothetical protein